MADKYPQFIPRDEIVKAHQVLDPKGEWVPDGEGDDELVPQGKWIIERVMADCWEIPRLMSDEQFREKFILLPEGMEIPEDV